MRIRWFQHVPFEGLGYIEHWAKDHRYDVHPTRHWHGDTFDLPSGSVRIAESAACQNQAFCFEDRIFGLQFHLEITKQGAESLISNCGDEIVEGPFIQSTKRILGRERNFIKANAQMSQLLDAFARVSG